MFGSMKLYGLEILLRHDWQHKAEYLLQFLIPKIAELALSLPALVTKVYRLLLLL
jgi:hypothetical protein